MTACVKNHSKRVALAISASLVGALTLGAAAPAVAFADDGASTQALDPEPMANGDVEYKGGSLTTEYTYNGRPQGPVPVKVKPYNEDVERLEGILPKGGRKKDSYYYYYVKIENTNTNAPSTKVSYVNEYGDTVALTGVQVKDAEGNNVKPTEAGTYAVVIGQVVDAAGTVDNYIGVADTFTITGQELDLAQLCDELDATDSTFNYTGEDGSTMVSEILDRINVQMNGRLLEKGVDYTITLWDQGGKNQITPSTRKIGIGTKYIVKIDGVAGGAFDGQEVEREFTLNQLDLSTAEIAGTTQLWASGGANRPAKGMALSDAISTLNGIPYTDLGGGCTDQIELEFVSNPKDQQTSPSDVYGAYTFKLKAKDGATNVTGETTFTVWYAQYQALIDYSGEATEVEPDSFVVDLSDPDSKVFDVDDIDVYYNYATSGKKNIPANGYKIAVTDAEGNVVDDMTKPGTYTVRVDAEWVDPDNGNQFVAGSKTFKVVVQYSVDQDYDVFFSYKGQNVVTDTHDTYDGEDKTANMSLKVKVDTGELAEGTDYEVVYEKVNGDGSVEEVDQIVDAGYYNVVVRGITFAGDYIFDFEVKPQKITPSNVDSPFTVRGKTVLAWTGDVLAPDFVDAKGNVIPKDLYDVEYVRDIDEDEVGETVELKDKGKYKAYLTTKDGVTNYEVEGMVKVRVTDAKVFSDVPSAGEWYSEPVYLASRMGYMTGYNGTTLFGPEDTIKRGDVAVALYKMAGGHLQWDEVVNEGGSTDDVNYKTPFSDVDENSYWAQAIQWAERMGVVTGYDGTDLFMPDATISRQELATMLYRYAKVADLEAADVETDASELDAYADAGQVAAFAKDAVLWAVNADVMGQDVTALRPADAISRAEVAAMTVRVQPDGRLDFDDMMDRF
ncbi:S-layer homology domain-containing protein [Enorma phocaeensis]|uniref:S-layer homology domain-containing protein n=1 Tax=Enorma phocaeensis TaxID=1871019 RepID=UPI00195E3E71|nr:S-layer homology domain-containing protein [Enorma phocaeensis]MBM6953988.1 S-layer homology domain-containing protein [Enorma phocaeensis]